MAVKVASDMEIFVVLNEATGPVTWEELAAPRNAARALVGIVTLPPAQCIYINVQQSASCVF
jgi:hypothetical protein